MPGVVGDLVVGEEGRVDRRAGRRGRRRRRSATCRSRWTTVAPGADEGVGAAAGDPRPDVVADLACAPPGARGRCRRGRGRGCGRPRRAGRSRRRSRLPIGRRRCSAVLIVSIECGASPERMLARLAPSACSRPAPVGVPPLDLFRVARVVGDDRRAAVLLPPAEGRHVLVGAVQQPRLAGAGLRGPVGLPALQPVRAAAQPARRGSARCRRAIARRRTSWARPSISRKRTPGTSLSTVCLRRRACRRTTLRYQESSSSIAKQRRRRRR